MSDIAISVENLSKRYRIGVSGKKHDTFGGAMTNFLSSPARNLRRLRRLSKFSENEDDQEDVIWALREVSFQVKPGEVLGIIGPNGAGKSTLLKILSRITEPTGGQVEISGRVGSLLEVGTGFHPELTGRENVYMNGTVLGMSRREVDRKFDEIVDFSGVEKFIDTPVKRYSSGMTVRLAFAVAAHLDPEILIIDEVLAVGDASFQRKCLGMMSDVAKDGRTVLFVSHNIRAIGKLCKRVLLLKNGELDLDGESRNAIATYLSAGQSEKPEGASLDVLKRASGLGILARFTKCELLNSRGAETESVLFGEPFSISLEARVIEDIRDVCINLAIFSDQGDFVTIVESEDSGWLYSASPSQLLLVCARFNDLMLTPGVYWLTIGIRHGFYGVDQLPNILKIEVLEVAYGEQRPHSRELGLIHTTAQWTEAN